MSVALAALLLMTAPPPPPPGGFEVHVTNRTKAPARCFVMTGGPITQLVTLAPGRTLTRNLPRPGGALSLSCPKLRDTVFGPVPAGRYELRTVKGRPELVLRP